MLRRHYWSPGLALTALVLVPAVGIVLVVAQLPLAQWPKVALENLESSLFYLSNTFQLVGLSALLALVFGFVPAWLVAYFRFPAARFFDYALILPLALPPWMVSIFWIEIIDFNPMLTPIRQALPPLPTRSLPAASLVFAATLYPYVYTLARNTLRSQRTTIWEAGRCCGLGPSAIFFKLALPLSRPALAIGLTLVIFEVVNDYGLVALYGIPTLSSGIYENWFILARRQQAAALALQLLVIGLFLAALEQHHRAKRSYQAQHKDLKATDSRQILRGGQSLLAFLCCLIPLSLGFILPLLQMAISAAQIPLTSSMTKTLIAALGDTFLLATIATALCVLCATWLAASARKSSRPTLLARNGYMMPGVVVAIGLLSAFNWLLTRLDAFSQPIADNLAAILIGSLALLVIGLFIRFLAVALAPIENGWQKIPLSFDDAAATLGTRPLAAFFRIHLPLLRPALLTAIALVMLEIIKELPVTLLLSPFNFQTIAALSFQHAENENFSLSALPALCLALIGVTLLLPAFAPFLLQRRAEQPSRKPAIVATDANPKTN